MNARTWAISAMAILSAVPVLAADSDTEGTPVQLDKVVVYGREENLIGIVDSASIGQVGAAELADRPFLRRGELLEVVPGLIITQHSGDGKANQYFLRGFNLDHGTDFATTVDGVPVNLPSNAHGQGYSDLNFIIPELVQNISFEKGTYFAANGDFSAAGAAQFHLVDTISQPLAKIEAGAFGFFRGLAAESWTGASGGATILAVEYGTYNGPWTNPEDAQHETLCGRQTWTVGNSKFAVTAAAYHSAWNSTDQVPLRAIDDGLISRFGAIDPSDGGTTSRESLSFDWTRGDADATTRVVLYALYYRLNLFSNFTYFLDDPVDGDQFNQQDRRGIFGGSGSREWSSTIAGRKVSTTAGFQERSDIIALGLLHTQDRKPLNAVDLSSVHEYSGGTYVESRADIADWLRVRTGLRADAADFDVSDSIRGNSGRRSAAILSPKLEIVFGPWAGTEVYIDAGDGFHSNDARGVVEHVDPQDGSPAQPVTPLVRAEGMEFGARTSPVSGLTSTVSLWALDLGSELTFDGDSGETGANGPTRRYGIEFANFYHATPWLAFDGDLSFTHARYREANDSGFGSGYYIPNSIRAVVSAGASANLSSGWFASLRARYFGPRPLVETGVAWEPSSIVWNGRLGWHNRNWEIAAELLNVFARQNDDIAYYYKSRLPNEPAGGVDDIHVHPAEPRMFRAAVTRRF